MDYINTILAVAIVKGEDVKEVFRQQLEIALNQLYKSCIKKALQPEKSLI